MDGPVSLELARVLQAASFKGRACKDLQGCIPEQVRPSEVPEQSVSSVGK